jgi:alpha-glucoside transport system substrate-binding protein
MRRSYKILGVISTVLLLLAACTPAATTAPTNTTAPVAAATNTTAPATAATAEPTAVPTIAPPQTTGTIDCMGAQPGDKLTVMYQWSGSEEAMANAIFAPLVQACGIQLVTESTRDNAILDARVKSTPPDILFWPTLAPISLYASQLQPLDTLGGVAANYANYWIALGTTNGNWVAVPAKADVKSIIWYSPAQFAARGYTVPTTFDELNTLVEKMVSDGVVPWSTGFESGAATGWTGSDFIQDLLLTSQGPGYVNKLLSGDVLYNDPGVLEAYQTYFKWASDPKYTVGGATGTVSTGFLDAIYKVFSDPPEAMMVKQSGFAGGEIKNQYPTLVYGTDYDFFQFPGIQGLQGGADYMMAFGTSNAAKAMVAYITGPVGAQAWAKIGFNETPNKLAAGNFADPVLAKQAEILNGSAGFTPDLGDTIPAPFGDAEWKAIVNVVQGSDIQTELDTVAAAQKQALGK